MYPALAVAEAIRNHQPDVELLDELIFVGSVDGFERPLVQESGIPFNHYDEVQSGPLHGVSWPRRLLSLLRLAAGTLQSLALVRKRKPDVLLLTGGWVGLPIALACWILRIPSLIVVPDIEPGLAIKVLQRFASRVAVIVPDSQVHFPPGKSVVTGYPLRRQMLTATRDEAIKHFGLDPKRHTLLVFGGSRGAQSINKALSAILPDLLADGIQIIHISGTLDWPRAEARRASLSEADATHYHAFPYLHQEMGLAMAAADLVVSRAGASTLGEFPVFGLPAILVPYPHAWLYQQVNAEYLASRGAAVIMKDEDMPRDLLTTVRGFFGDLARLGTMRASAAALAQPDAAWTIGQELLRLSKSETKR